MHPFLGQSLADQHRAQLLAEAHARRHIAVDPRLTHGLLSVRATALSVRPIRTDDGDRLKRLFGRLSPRSVLFRFFSPIRELSPALLARLIDVDHHYRDALVALEGDDIVAVARYDGQSGSREPEVAFTVVDDWQRCGVGTRVARRLMTLAAARDFEAFLARILPENRPALAFARALSPRTSIRWDAGEYLVSIPLR